MANSNKRVILKNNDIEITVFIKDEITKFMKDCLEVFDKNNYQFTQGEKIIFNDEIYYISDLSVPYHNSFQHTYSNSLKLIGLDNNTKILIPYSDYVEILNNKEFEILSCSHSVQYLAKVLGLENKRFISLKRKLLVIFDDEKDEIKNKHGEYEVFPMPSARINRNLNIEKLNKKDFEINDSSIYYINGYSKALEYLKDNSDITDILLVMKQIDKPYKLKNKQLEFKRLLNIVDDKNVCIVTQPGYWVANAAVADLHNFYLFDSISGEHNIKYDIANLKLSNKEIFKLKYVEDKELRERLSDLIDEIYDNKDSIKENLDIAKKVRDFRLLLITGINSGLFFLDVSKSKEYIEKELKVKFQDLRDDATKYKDYSNEIINELAKITEEYYKLIDNNKDNLKEIALDNKTLIIPDSMSDFIKENFNFSTINSTQFDQPIDNDSVIFTPFQYERFYWLSNDKANEVVTHFTNNYFKNIKEKLNKFNITFDYNFKQIDSKYESIIDTPINNEDTNVDNDFNRSEKSVKDLFYQTINRFVYGSKSNAQKIE